MDASVSACSWLLPHRTAVPLYRTGFGHSGRDILGGTVRDFVVDARRLEE